MFFNQPNLAQTFKLQRMIQTIRCFIFMELNGPTLPNHKGAQTLALIINYDPARPFVCFN